MDNFIDWFFNGINKIIDWFIDSIRNGVELFIDIVSWIIAGAIILISFPIWIIPYTYWYFFVKKD